MEIWMRDISTCDHWRKDQRCSRCGSETTGRQLCPRGPVTLRMQGVDCPYCEDGTEHSHFQGLAIRDDLAEGDWVEAGYKQGVPGIPFA
ncbi:hypothetical protein LCGC14_0312710 [marine sediment metagenome]|uniref:Uncharacterized protein n=1 Tax=marine sediment metagenome TaxID=412755 RepID=A0A0F9TRP6_9ZZZZ